MLRWRIFFLLLTLPNAAFAQVPNVRVQYEAYAAGLPIAHVETGLSFGPKAYEISLAYHTTGVAGVFFQGHQTNTANGVWSGKRAAPAHFLGQGVWRGEDRIADIDYDQGKPVVQQLIPPNIHEREEVPEALRVGAVDPLSALAVLIHTVDTTGRCEAAARTFDGRRTTEIEARTAGEEQLAPSLRSSFQGKALRCDFVGRMLAGFRLDGSKAQESKPMHGSAWLAAVAAGAPPLPVRIAFQTRWFGDATMYLTSVGEDPERRVARSD